MKRPDRNPDWFFSLYDDTPQDFLPGDFSRYRRARPDELRAGGIPCVCVDFIACSCGASKDAGNPRVPLTRTIRIERGRYAREPPVAWFLL
jgi:hypothetical protein